MIFEERRIYLTEPGVVRRKDRPSLPHSLSLTGIRSSSTFFRVLLFVLFYPFEFLFCGMGDREGSLISHIGVGRGRKDRSYKGRWVLPSFLPSTRTLKIPQHCFSLRSSRGPPVSFYEEPLPSLAPSS
jgi:hypothetical protein